MNLEKLKDYEAEFLEQYPSGFEDGIFFPSMKKFNHQKLQDFAKDVLRKENFQNPNLVVEGFFKVIQKSIFVSLFDKLKLRDMIITLNSYEKDILSIELYELLYGNKKDGFEGLVEFLAQYKLAKWTILSVVPYSLNPNIEYFIKPTTTKMIIKTFELKDLIYKPRPSFEFYENYSNQLDKMKSKVNKNLSPNNVGFTAFLKVCIENFEDK